MVRRLHPIDKEILRALMGSKIKVTPSQISKSIGIHPVTAQKRIKELVKINLVKCKLKGNRKYCRINMPKILKYFNLLFSLKICRITDFNLTAHKKYNI